MLAFLRDTLITVILAAVIFFGLQATVQSIVVEGHSMNLSFQDGQRILVSRVVYKFHEPERGDVIVFHPPNGQQGDYIKRIIGLPGERIEIKEGTVYIHKENRDAFPLDEPYVAEQTNRAFRGDKIPEGEYFVLGDNRKNSDDSRSGWTLPRQNIIGKVWLLIWPPDNWGLVANYPLQEE